MTRTLHITRTTKAWNETTTREGAGGLKITRALVSYTWSGSAEGDSALDYSMVYLPTGVALFVGFELVHVTIDRRSSTFVLRHDGTFEAGTATIAVQVVPGSGSGEFGAVTGQGRIEADRGDPMKSVLRLDLEQA